jgi:hypothetical protein
LKFRPDDCEVQDVQTFEYKIKDERNRTEQLKGLLFTPALAYNGCALFDLFIDDVQDQIKILLVEAVAKLQEAVDLLGKRYNPRSYDNAGYLSSNIFDKMRQSSKSPIRVIQWSFRDKKRTEVLLTDFTDLNRRIHENIKLFILGSSLAVNPEQHLRYLQDNPASQKLGFDIDATLRLHVEQTDEIEGDSELPEHPWCYSIATATTVPRNENQYAVINDSNSYFLVEYHRYAPDPLDSTIALGTEVDSKTRTLLNGLARLLQEPKEEEFLIPRCHGWKYDPTKKRIAFVFDTPQGFCGTSVSLLDLLRKPATKVTLTMKLQIAFGLARSISNLHMVQWVLQSHSYSGSC